MHLVKIYQILPMNLSNMMPLVIISFVSILSLIMFIPSTKKEKANSSKSSKINITKVNIMSLFLSFDPKSSLGIVLTEMNWIILILVTNIYLYFFWAKKTRLEILNKTFAYNMANQFEIALKSSKDSAKLMFITLFLLLFSVNLMGLVPNLFTPTSHITMNLFLAIPMWVGVTIFGWVKYTNSMFAHLVPNGTPFPLISFMVLIELISSVIRPLTLSIRLMANMVSGHLLLTLMGNSMVASSSKLTISMMVLTQSVLTLLEIGVSMIQAYVFCMLMVLYSDESDYSVGH